jgi:hypothetical protein
MNKSREAKVSQNLCEANAGGAGGLPRVSRGGGFASASNDTAAEKCFSIFDEKARK